MARQGPKAFRVEAAVKVSGGISAGCWDFGTLLVRALGNVEVCGYRGVLVSDLVHLREVSVGLLTPLLLVSGIC